MICERKILAYQWGKTKSCSHSANQEYLQREMDRQTVIQTDHFHPHVVSDTLSPPIACLLFLAEDSSVCILWASSFIKRLEVKI